MSDKKRDARLPSEEDEQISDEAEFDDFEDEDEELESSVCPICRENYCSEHLVTATCCDDADVRGAIGAAWEIGAPLAKSVLRRAYLKCGAIHVLVVWSCEKREVDRLAVKLKGEFRVTRTDVRDASGSGQSLRPV